MQDNEEARAEWGRLVADMLQQDPPITPEEWRRQLALECILARLLAQMFLKVGEHEVIEAILAVPETEQDKAAYANVFRRITFIMRDRLRE